MEMGEDEIEMRCSWIVADRFLEKQKDDGGGHSIGSEIFFKFFSNYLSKFEKIRKVIMRYYL